MRDSQKIIFEYNFKIITWNSDLVPLSTQVSALSTDVSAFGRRMYCKYSNVYEKAILYGNVFGQ